MPRDEILIRLKSIEEKLDKSERRAQWQWMYGLGIGLMIASLAVLPLNVWGAVVMFIVGYLLMLFALYKK
jgi:Flp pilus assembly protein TadB